MEMPIFFPGSVPYSYNVEEQESLAKQQLEEW